MSCFVWIGIGQRYALGVFVFVAIIAVLDEWHQAYLPGRSADLIDLSVDVVAADCTYGLIVFSIKIEQSFPYYE